ncbi:MAG TPA: membrane protein insertion efficiency factor YidD [Spirochaetota bacterium]|nr:membrane protein insertion efficiency factor YidD [Spirochaetota bacterium]HOS32090.1 membrane protein insertion efficiency factor YidD [Spirochaetota bacterium]HOS55431.1 membrane protein insertion efficiency factor YidD [Spirochaetota bacterium]HPK61825.1 membrane protein insertion efficiency factor YidD [Spirochaetota bacterium]HQF78009.1 membrane protein insertion efficiency factor YidD [Spirochaetota bacterium]
MLFLNKIVILFINIYKKFISPLSVSSCRFYPSCSEYARQAFVKYNFFKAFFYTLYRLIRCGPWSKGGYDPLERHWRDDGQ